MKKAVFYFGPKRVFLKLLPADVPCTSLTALALHSDAKQREHLFRLHGRPEEDSNALREHIPCVTAFSDEYAALTENAISGFLSFLSQFDIDVLYLQNPPSYLVEQLGGLGIELESMSYQYPKLDADFLRRFAAEYPKRIIGQADVLRQLLRSIYPLSEGTREKPTVLLFYGPTGVGKTETAKLIGELCGQTVFRKQFSMFQSGDFISYLFGGSHSQNCLAKELLERESNILLFDEFDKPNPLFHSAFYQLFDEGIYQDKNYTVKIGRSLMICTSNYASEQEARASLGDPIFSRFDGVIGFDALSVEATRLILEREYDTQVAALEPFEREQIEKVNPLPLLLAQAPQWCNARKVHHQVQDTLSELLVQALLKG